MTANKGEYAQAGVDYRQIEPFKQAMIEVACRTVHLPERRGVYIIQDVLHAHGGVYEYRGRQAHRFCKTKEGLGNKNWVAELMYQLTGRPHYSGIGIDTTLMAANDNVAQGALPVVYADEVAASHSEWFTDELRARELVSGFEMGLELIGAALIQGESPALRYLINPLPPVQSAPSLSGTVTGIIAPKKMLITGKKLRAGDAIIGVTSSGIHANGFSLVIKRGLTLPEGFLTRLPSGRTLGEEALIPTRSYVGLVEVLLYDARVEIHAIVPGTGSGVAKVAYDKRPFTYRIHSWVEVPVIMQFMQELGVNLVDCLTTFNWGIGFYLFIPPHEVDRTLKIGAAAGYELKVVGRVEEGERRVIFEPENITLPPPGA